MSKTTRHKKRSTSFNSLGREETMPLRRFWNGLTFSKPKVDEENEEEVTVSTNLDDIGTYEDYHTIDWLRELCRNHLRHRQIKQKKHDSFFGWFRSLHDAASGWLVVLLTGLASGTCAGLIDTVTKWLTDLKFGICTTKFWMDKASCCWDTHVITASGNNCTVWKDWAEIIDVSNQGSIRYAVNYGMYVVTAVGLSTLAAILVKMFAPYACGSGIPEVKTILSGFIIKGYLGKWTLLIKCVTAPLSVASNLSLGKEGPLVHISACCGNIFSHLFPKYAHNEAKKREALSAAASAGVAVAFGVPIGGVLFSLEECSYYFPMKTLYRSFFCAMAAAFMLRSLNPFGSTHYVMFWVTYTRDWYLFELVPFALLGTLGGLYGSAFIHANLAWCKFRKTSRLGKWPIVEVMFVTVITAVASFPNPYTRINASAMINELVQECGPVVSNNLCQYSPKNVTHHITESERDLIGGGLAVGVWQLAVGFIFKVIITVFTFGLKVPTGLFIPSLGVGALMGRLMGIAMEQLVFNFPNCPLWRYVCHEGHECITPGMYAMVGAAATLGGVTRMTVSLAVVMYELTGGLTYIVPIMLGIIFSKWAGDAFGSEGIYDGHIKLNGFPYLEDKDDYTHTALVQDIMRPQPGMEQLVVLPQEGMTVLEMEDLVRSHAYNGFPVVSPNDREQLIGYVYRRDLIIALGNSRRCDGVYDLSVVHFTLHAENPDFPSAEDPAPVRLFNIVDFSPLTVVDHSPVEIIWEMYCKIGHRQMLVTTNGRLIGIVTKKDLLRHIADVEGEDPNHILYN